MNINQNAAEKRVQNGPWMLCILAFMMLGCEASSKSCSDMTDTEVRQYLLSKEPIRQQLEHVGGSISKIERREVGTKFEYIIAVVKSEVLSFEISLSGDCEVSFSANAPIL